MDSMEVTLMEVLDFHEEKMNVQRRMFMENPDGIVISLGMNIPGSVKTGSSILCAFHEGTNVLKNAILEDSGRIAVEQILERNAGYAAIYLIQGIDRRKLKEIAVSLEETHPLGRLFDVDVLKENLESISRTDLGIARRKCLICGGDAKICGRSRAHTIQELQAKTAAIIEQWKERQQLWAEEQWEQR